MQKLLLILLATSGAKGKNNISKGKKSYTYLILVSHKLPSSSFVAQALIDNSHHIYSFTVKASDLFWASQEVFQMTHTPTLFLSC